MEIYENAKKRITVGGKVTSEIKRNAGVKQVCPLLPFHHE